MASVASNSGRGKLDQRSAPLAGSVETVNNDTEGDSNVSTHLFSTMSANVKFGDLLETPIESTSGMNPMSLQEPACASRDDSTEDPALDVLFLSNETINYPPMFEYFVASHSSRASCSSTSANTGTIRNSAVESFQNLRIDNKAQAEFIPSESKVQIEENNSAAAPSANVNDKLGPILLPSELKHQLKIRLSDLVFSAMNFQEIEGVNKQQHGLKFGCATSAQELRLENDGHSARSGSLTALVTMLWTRADEEHALDFFHTYRYFSSSFDVARLLVACYLEIEEYARRKPSAQLSDCWQYMERLAASRPKAQSLEIWKRAQQTRILRAFRTWIDACPFDFYENQPLADFTAAFVGIAATSPALDAAIATGDDESGKIPRQCQATLVALQARLGEAASERGDSECLQQLPTFSPLGTFVGKPAESSLMTPRLPPPRPLKPRESGFFTLRPASKCASTESLNSASSWRRTAHRMSLKPFASVCGGASDSDGKGAGGGTTSGAASANHSRASTSTVAVVSSSIFDIIQRRFSHSRRPSCQVIVECRSSTVEERDSEVDSDDDESDEDDEESDLERGNNSNNVEEDDPSQRATQRQCFANVDAREFAKDLTRIEHAYFARIRIDDFFAQAWTKKDERSVTAVSRGSLREMIAWFNRVASAVATEVVRMIDAKTRVKTIKHFVAAAQECARLSNFNGVFEIVAGLNMGPVSRLKKTVGDLSLN
ncbi:hypothetical protein HDU84_004022 [Entophlyctis sp. JEL0112]|nr:hypothetical protein HDU84_004022 [Entophlyctis sp. JEL0112]